MTKSRSLSCVEQEVVIEVAESQGENGDEKIVISIVLCATYVLKKGAKKKREEIASPFDPRKIEIA